MFPHERSLVTRLADKPFALVGVSCDEDRAALRSMIQKEHLTWPNVWDGQEGRIFERWNIQQVPSIYVLDANGTIRFTPDEITDAGELDRRVDELLDEVERKRKVS